MGGFAFDDHISLLDRFIDRHREIGERIEQALLNVQGKPTSTRRDRPFFETALDACFFGLAGLPAGAASLRGQLLARQIADGLAPERRDRFSNDLDPLELVVRAYDQWSRTRWPGRSGRLVFASCIFAVFMLRQLERMTLRLWDAGGGAGSRLQALQQLLDRLNAASGIAFVRDARWLIATAQSPLTPDVAPYFRIAEAVAGSLPAETGLEAHIASVQMTSGHLRSQLRYGMARTGKGANDPELLAFTRNSNAMDLALMVQDLVPVLDAYRTACRLDNTVERRKLAEVACQGFAADPDLLLVRLDLLTAYTMIEGLFVADEGRDWDYTPMGKRHLDLVDRYATLVRQLAPQLSEDLVLVEPASASYSPLGIVYGFSVDVLSNIAMARLAGQPASNLSFEDTFLAEPFSYAKAERADAWARLPSRPAEGTHFEHSLEFARVVYDRLHAAIANRASRPDAMNASGLPDARLFVFAAGVRRDERAPADAESSQAWCFTSDVSVATTIGAVPWPKADLTRERQEGWFLASDESGGHIFALSKMVLTAHLAAGKHAVVTDVPMDVARKFARTCPLLAVVFLS